ncbi:MAG: hypothetical protein KBG20_04500 [Caldilineaceae bacterium]|nr:hypothetical protein [Caldilineaceae bacterium]MBP8106208.1 hypothetical protein [Caldilineaceae bacterium]MBP8121139.1 hypothetical protein [Caldilineaceae bacterium]MBP9071532.1 hypothetical protein [Caldilineaceae bacterium]
MKPDDQPRFAVCVKNAGYQVSLDLHKIYRLVDDSTALADGDVRIIDESGEDYLYPADWFIMIDVPQQVEQSLLRVAA